MYRPPTAACWGGTAGHMKGDFPALTAARRWLCCSMESNCQARRGMGREEEEERGVGCSDAEVQSSSQPWIYRGNGQAAAAYSG